LDRNGKIKDISILNFNYYTFNYGFNTVKIVSEQKFTDYLSSLSADNVSPSTSPPFNKDNKIPSRLANPILPFEYKYTDDRCGDLKDDSKTVRCQIYNTKYYYWYHAEGSPYHNNLNEFMSE
jgi:hypothetical protein